MDKKERYLPATKWHDIGQGVSWRYYRHWATNCFAAEEKAGMIESPKDGQDYSGYCFRDRHPSGLESCSVPMVALAREYKKGDGKISALLSYPQGITISDQYLWEIYGLKGCDMSDVERFYDEDDMEKRIIEIFANPL